MTPRPWPQRPWPDAVPRYATKRNFDRDTLGPELVDISRKLGYEPMPWNVEMWNTQYEYTVVDDPLWGEVKRLWYREARITVPRQSSKTTSALVRHVDRMVNGEARGWGGSPVSLFTMQHAAEARKKIVKVWMPVLRSSPFYIPSDRDNRGTPESAIRQFVLSNGKEGIEWANDGRMETFPPTGKGGHGDVVDLTDIDEAFAMVDDRAEDGVRPAMIARPSPQLCVESTAGTADSLYLLDKVEDGRALVDSGIDSHIMYLEYAADLLAGDDLHDPDHWHRWMPALGYTQSLDVLKIEHDNYMRSSDPDKGEAGWARAFGNLWTGRTIRLIPPKAWAKCLDPESAITERRLWLAADSSPGPSPSSSVSIAGYRADGSIHVEVLAHHAGKEWLAETIGKITRAQSIEKLYVDPKGPINSVLPDIRLAANTNVEIIDAETMGALSGRFLDAVIGGKVFHRGQPPLDAAVEGAAKRTLLDSWAFARRPSSEDISPLVSCAEAHWGAILNPQRGLISMAPG